MKKRKYLSFLFPKLIVSLLIAAVVFGIMRIGLEITYESASASGFKSHRERYESIVRKYAETGYDKVFVDIIINFFPSDYFRLVEVKEDGRFETVTETDYKCMPVEERMHHWYYITNDKDLLAKGKITTKVNGNDWTIEYKKCDEAWNFKNFADTKVTNSWDRAAQSDVYYSDLLFTFALDYSGVFQYRQPVAKGHYVEGETLHLGKVVETYGGISDPDRDPFFAKKWDFTDPSKADRYIAVDGDGFVKYLSVFPQRVRPDDFLNRNSGMFLANSMSELQKEYEKKDEKYADMEDLFKEYAEKRFVSGEYNYYEGPTSEYSDTEGRMDFYAIDGKLYMVEYVISTVPFIVLFKPFLILSAILLAIAAVVIALLSSIKPYCQYKKAYENNSFKNSLIDSLAHNMKTPLQILGGYAENLKDVTSDEEKDRYADRILEKTNEMNKDIEAILKTAEKSDRKFTKESIRMCFEEVASKLGVEIYAKGDKKIKMDRDYFKTAIYCLLDNAMKYKSADSKIEIDITCKAVTIKNKTDKDKFTPGTGIAIAGRILEQHKLKFRTTLKDGVFEVKFGKKLGKK